MYEETVWQDSRGYRCNRLTSRVREFYEECERKEVCKTEKECVEIGDKKLQKVYEKIDGLSELEAVEDYEIEEHESADMKKAEQKKKMMMKIISFSFLLY